MKILFITPRLPCPPHGGDKLRAFNFIKYLSRKHSIYLVSFIESEKELEYVAPMKEYCADVEVILLKPIHSYLSCLFYSLSLIPFQVAYYRDRRMKNKISEIINREKIDGIYIHLLRMAQYVKDIKAVNRILDLTDSLSLSLKRSLRFRNHLFFLFYFVEWLKISIYEPRIIQHFDRCLLISAVDKEATNLLRGAENISIISNGVDFNYFRPTGRQYNPNSIVFIGNLHSFPNRDAVLYCYRDILPLIKRAVPDIKFYIVGINPPKKILELAKDKNVIITGGVDDSRPYLSDAAVMVCPIRVATGMQNKILEAMAMGLPTISTSIATLWMDKKEDSGVLIVDTPAEFAKKVIEVIKNKDLREQLSINARKLIVENYDWNKNIKKLELLFEEGIK